jgi:hypothetical protein
MVLILANFTELMLPMLVCAGEIKRLEENCRAGDPKVRINAEINRIEIIQKTETLIGFQISVDIDIADISQEPVLVLKGTSKDGTGMHPYNGAILLARTKADAISCHYIYSYGAYPSTHPYWQNLRKELDQKTPPSYVISKIDPGGSVKFNRKIVFVITNDKEQILDKILRDPDIWLQVEVLTWPSNLEKTNGTVFGKRLQNKWKHQGHLVIENLKTNPVRLTLPFTKEPLAPTIGKGE